MSSSRPVKETGWKLTKAIFLGFFHREFHDRADLVVVDVVNDGDDQYDFDAGFVHVFDGA